MVLIHTRVFERSVLYSKRTSGTYPLPCHSILDRCVPAAGVRLIPTLYGTHALYPASTCLPKKPSDRKQASAQHAIKERDVHNCVDTRTRNCRFTGPEGTEQRRGYGWEGWRSPFVTGGVGMLLLSTSGCKWTCGYLDPQQPRGTDGEPPPPSPPI